jgi:hypothetical protein
MSSQRISEIFECIDFSHKIDFYTRWSIFINDKECLALNITSISSYSKMKNDCKWYHNRDNEKLPQINLCLLLEKSHTYQFFKHIIAEV